MAGDRPTPGPVPISTESFAEASRLLRIVALAKAVDEPGPPRLAALVDGRLALRPHTVDLAADAAIREAAHTVLTHGWQPVEVHTFGARRLDAVALSYLVDALVAAAQWSPGAPWFAELSALRARVWWTAGQPHLGQWAARHGQRRLDAVRTAVDVLALLTYLPRTDSPQPNTPAPPAVAPEALVRDERIVARIDALLARAGRSDYPDEAVACASKAQELMVRYATGPLPASGMAAADGVAAALRRLCAENPLLVARTLLARARLRAGRRPRPARALPAAERRPLPVPETTGV
jgi:Protein of unknown function (DUF2786)